jgi:hypothetical protein
LIKNKHFINELINNKEALCSYRTIIGEHKQFSPFKPLTTELMQFIYNSRLIDGVKIKKAGEPLATSLNARHNLF